MRKEILCVDGTCSGIIGKDDCCNECGEPYSPESEGKAELGVDEQKIISSSSSPPESSFSGEFFAAILIISGVVLWLWGYYDNEQMKVSTSSSGFDFSVLDDDNSPDKSKSPKQNNTSQVVSKKGTHVINRSRTTISTKGEKTPSATLSFSVEKPPAGSDNILGIAQIRYCLAEEIILKAMDIYLDAHSEPEVKAYNFYIDDYYKRCRSFRFRSGEY